MSQPAFTTARLVLQPAALADLDELWTIWRDPEVRRYLFDDEEVDRERAAEALRTCLEPATRGLGLWMIRERAGAAVLGCAGILPVLAAEYDPTIAGLIEPLASLAPSAWGRGYADESLVALLVHGFDGLGLDRFAGVVDVPNLRSHRMLVRLGFRERHECQGPRYRMRIYSLAREEFARRAPEDRR